MTFCQMTILLMALNGSDVMLHSLCRGDNKVRNNWLYDGLQANKQKILKKAPSDGPSAILRPLFNSNLKRVYIIKWSQNLIQAHRSSVFGIPKSIKITCFVCIFQIFGYAKNTTSASPNKIQRPFYNIYFCHITIEKWFRIALGALLRIFCFWARLPL